MQCRFHATQLGRLYADFQAADTEVMVILGDSLERARSYSDTLRLPFAVLADPQRAVYHLFGLGRAMFGIQRTASVLIDSAGIIRYLKQAINPNHWLAESGALLAAARGLGAPGLSGAVKM